MYEVRILALGKPLVKQVVSELPKPLNFVEVCGHLTNVEQSGDTYEYNYTDGFVLVHPIADDEPLAEAEAPYPFVVTILDLDEAEVAGTYGPYADEDIANDKAEQLLERHRDDDPHTPYESCVTPVYPS